MSEEFSHIDEDGGARMVDVGAKSPTQRTAVAQAEVRLSQKTFGLLVEKALPKGDVLTTAKVAGILAAKQTHLLIPMCHPLPLSYVDINFEIRSSDHTVRILAEARTADRTGVEMEALTAASVAALTIYDMCKAVQKDIIVDQVRLLKKTGGKSGDFIAEI
ncbi:MAG: cyclic pyranopterin monophosphate synthase MoaC [Desulfovibrio sp.]|uniref:cyclic pyranopterin monophosphate synthase MoaC n=1 Tax=Desulfovibrio sp. 7SRBS1 TaxID=3378064 RepID=UPI003B414964